MGLLLGKAPAALPVCQALVCRAGMGLTAPVQELREHRPFRTRLTPGTAGKTSEDNEKIEEIITSCLYLFISSLTKIVETGH